jgi:LytS/YehU family sensor histidine kinase
MPASKVVKNVVRDYAIIALATSIYIINDWRQKDKENKQLAEAKAQSDLELLKRQLHPHFLFNTLNNIYSLSLKNSDLTGDSILKLSKLLEYLVYQSGEKEVLLADEMDLVKNYIALEKLRYGNELQVKLEIKGLVNQLKTAPLIVLPFVENCFKHGGKNENGVFWININVKGYEQLLTIFIENSKSKKKKIGKVRPSGVGLSNIADRLELLYPGKHKLDIEESMDFYSIKLELNL